MNKNNYRIIELHKTGFLYCPSKNLYTFLSSNITFYFSWNFTRGKRNRIL